MRCAEEQRAGREHPQRQARTHQRDVDRRRGLQRQVLEGVVQPDAQQPEQGVALPVRPHRAVGAQHRGSQRQQQNERDHPAQEVQRERRHQLAHQPAHHGIAGPQQRRHGEQEDGEGRKALMVLLWRYRHGRRLYRAMSRAALETPNGGTMRLFFSCVWRLQR
jgi:hypothetical protein